MRRLMIFVLSLTPSVWWDQVSEDTSFKSADRGPTPKTGWGIIRVSSQRPTQGQ